MSRTTTMSRFEEPDEWVEEIIGTCEECGEEITNIETHYISGVLDGIFCDKYCILEHIRLERM